MSELFKKMACEILPFISFGERKGRKTKCLHAMIIFFEDFTKPYCTTATTTTEIAKTTAIKQHHQQWYYVQLALWSRGIAQLRGLLICHN